MNEEFFVDENEENSEPQDNTAAFSLPSSQVNQYSVGVDASLARLSNDFATEDTAARSANIETGLATDPVKWGKAKRIAERRNTDVDLVFNNFEEFEAKDKELLLADIVNKNPALKELSAESPEFMKLAANDCDKLQEISNNLTIFGTMEKPIKPVAMAKTAAYLYNENERRLDLYEEIGDLMTKEDDESNARLAVLVDEANKASLVDTSGFADFGYNFVEQLPYMKRTMLPKLAATAAGAGADALVSAKAGAAGGAAVGSVAPGAGTAAGAVVGGFGGAVVGTVKGAMIGNAIGTAVAFKNTYDVESGSMFANLAVMKDENGQSFDRGDMVAIARTYGALSAAVELLPMETMARLVPGYNVAKKGMLKAGFKKAVQEALKDKTKAQLLRGILKDMTFAAGSEGLEESVQELLQVVGERHLQDKYNDKQGYNFEKTPWNDDIARISNAGYQGFKASLIMPIVSGSARAYVETKALNEVRAIDSLQRGDGAKAELDAARMDNVQNQIQQLGELKEQPEQLKVFLQRATRQSDLRDVYMSIEDAKALLQSEAVKNNEDALQKLGVLDSMRRQIANQQEQGGAVKISFADYGATVMSRQELYAAFKDVVKTYEDGMTMSELRQKQKSLDNIVAEGKKLKDKNQSDFDYIYGRLVENAAIAGIQPEQAKTTAELNAYFYLGLARLHNMSPVQMFQNDSLNFDYKIDGQPARSAQLDKIIDVIREEQIKGADQNLLRASRVVARKDINAIKKTLMNKIENPNTADVKEYIRLLNAISDMKINLEGMSNEDFAGQLKAYTAQSPITVDIARSDADKIKSGIFSASEKALADIQDKGASGDYVLVGGGRVPVNYEIVELGDLVTSHNADGAVNEAFPQELQPRDRSRSASDAQINEIVNNFAPERVAKAPTATEGAPIVTQNNIVAVGNGRAMAISKVYENAEKAEQYRNYLTEQGYDVENFAEPVLVRKLAIDLDNNQLRALVDDANTAGTMQYSDAEKAITYSKKLTGEIIDLLDTDAELESAANRRFVREFFANVVPTAERNAFLDKDDRVTKKGIEMIENTLTAIIVPDVRFLSVLVENPDNNIRKVTSGLAKSAPAIVAFENDILSGQIDAKYSIAPDIRQAVEILKRAKDKGQSLDLYVKQLDLLEGHIPAEVLAVADLFDKSRSAVDFADKIKNYIHNASEQGDLAQGNMFGIEPVAKIALLERMNAQAVFNQGKITDNAGAVELTINTAEEMAGVSEDEFKQKMLDTLKSFKGNRIFNQSLGGEIEIRTSSIKKYKSFFADKNKRLIVPYIPELLAKARFDKIEDSYIPKKETNVLAYYKADMPINIDNNTYNVHLTVKKDNHGNLFWDAQVQEKSPSADPATNPGVKGLKAEQSAYKGSISLEKKEVNKSFYQLPPKAYKDGKADINTPEFKRWFGDSKVTTEGQGYGKPLKVFHGTDAVFSTFRMSGGFDFPDAAYFSSKKSIAKSYTNNNNIMEVYLKIENPYITDAQGQSYNDFYDHLVSDMDYAVRNGYDGVIVRNIRDDWGQKSRGGAKADTYIVFEPNQIKSVYNSGGFSQESDNIYYQSAFAGSRVDYDRPSLEAIGSGEGNQAHGWGLYYALNKDVAERYREDFVGKNKISFKGKTYDNTMPEFDALYKLAESQISIEQIKKDYKDNLQELKEFLKEAQEYNSTQEIVEYSKQIKETEKASKFFNTLTKKDIEEIKYLGGQVHEVDIPENPYLLDEQLPVNQQSEHIRKAVRDIMNKYPDDYISSENYETGSFGDALTGGSFYKQLMFIAQRNGTSDKIEQMKFASKILEENGVKGITYDGQQDGRCFVIFNPDDVKVIQKFYQQQTDEALGAYSPTSRTITLFKNANLSTLIHESGHFWREMIRKYAAMDGASEQLKAYNETLENWLDSEWSKHNEVVVQPDGSYTLFYNGEKLQEGFASRDEAIDTAKHECFARAVEKYFRTAEAPSFSLRKLFATFKGWLTRIYTNAEKLDVEISPEVKDIFDRLLASDGEIEQYVLEKRIRQMFEAPDKANMSQKQFDAYKQYMDNMLTVAKDDYYKSVAALAYKEKTAEFENKKEALRHDVLMDFSETPENRFVIAMVYGVIGDTKVDIKANAVEIKEIFNRVVDNGADRLPKRPDGSAIFADDGMSIAELSDFFGLSADIIKKQLSQSPKLVTAIEDTLRYRVHEELGSPVSYAEVEAQIVKSLHNEKYFDMLSLELSKISPNPDNQGAMEHALQARAEDIIGGLRITDIKPEKYFNQSLKAGDNAIAALNRGNKNAAYSYKRQQLMNFFLYREAQKQAERVEKTVRRLKEIGKKEVNPAVNQQHQDAVRAILGRYSLANALTKQQKERLGNLSKFIDEQRAAGYDIDIPAGILEAIDKKPYTEMSVDELLSMADLVKNIIHNGREIKTYELSELQVEKEKLLGEIAAQLAKSYKPREQAKTGKQTKHFFRDFAATVDENLVTLGGLCERIDDNDSNGVFHRAFLRPLTDAQNMENDLLQRFGSKMNELNKKLSEETKGALFENVEGAKEMLGADYTLGELISIGLNMGNYYNKQRMKANFGNRYNDALGWVAETLSKEQWDYIQGVWDLLDSMYPMLAEHQKKMSGLDMDQVVATPVVTPYGVYRGGYYPIVYDKTASMEARDKNSAETALLESDYGRATTAKGYTKSRLDRVNAPLKFGLAPISQHIASVIHDVAYRQTIRQLWNLVNSPTFMENFDIYLEPEYRDGICQLLKTIANQPNRDARAMKQLDKFLKIIRTRTTTMGLAFRFTTAVAQTLGFFSSVAALDQRGRKKGAKHSGKYWLWRGLKAFAQGAENREWALANSGELRARLNNNDVNIAEAMKGVGQEISRKEKITDSMVKAGFWLIGKVDFVVAQATWFAAYEQAKNEFGYEHQDAVFYADRIMIDSQGTGNLKDTPLFQRNGEIYRSMAMFYSPFAGLYQIWTQSVKDMKDNKQFAGAVHDLFVALVLPPLVEGLLKGDAPDADDGLAEWLKYLLCEPLFYWLSTLPIARDAASVMEFGRVPGSLYANAVNTVWSPVKRVYKMLEGKDVKESAFVKDLMNAISLSSGVPVGGQIADWTSYGLGAMTGSVKVDSPADVIYGIYRGKERKK